MLPRRGAANMSPGGALRQCLPGPGQTAAQSWRMSSRQFSQARLLPTAQHWDANASSLRRRGGPLPRLPRSAYPRSSTVFRAGIGASRALSLWPFGSKQQPPSTAADSTAAAQSTVVDSTAAAHSTVIDSTVAAQSTVIDSTVAAQSTTPPSPPLASATTPSPDPTSTMAQGAPSEPSSPSPSPETDSFSFSVDPGHYPDFDTTKSLLDIPEYLGYLKTMGLDYGWGPSSMIQWTLEHIHIWLGMPWWAATATLAISFRLAMFIPSLNQARQYSLMAQMKADPQYARATAAVDAAKNLNERLSALQLQRFISKRYGYSFVTTLWPAFVMVPFSFATFRVLRGMATLPVPSLETEGFAWLTDLTVHDPYYILPAAGAAMALLSIKLSSKANRTKLGPDQQTQSAQKLIPFVVIPLMVVCTMKMPGIVQWFFCVFGACGVAQTYAIIHPAVREFVGMHELPTSKPKTGISTPNQTGVVIEPPRKPPSQTVVAIEPPRKSKAFQQPPEQPPQPGTFWSPLQRYQSALKTYFKGAGGGAGVTTRKGERRAKEEEERRAEEYERQRAEQDKARKEQLKMDPKKSKMLADEKRERFGG